MKWDYTETLSKKDLIDILRGMADSLENKGELEAWIGNTKIVVDVAPQFILETIFDEDRQKGETHFHFHLSWIHEPEEKVSVAPTAPSEETISSQFEEITPGEEEPSIAHEEFLIDTTSVAPAAQSSPPSPSEAMSASSISPPAPEPPSQVQGQAIDDIPLPPSVEETQKDWREDFDKEMAEYGIPIESKATSEAVEQTKTTIVAESTPSVPMGTSVSSSLPPAPVQALEMYSVYESAFGWTIQNEWSEINPSSPGQSYAPTEAVPEKTHDVVAEKGYQKSKKERRDLETKPPEELEKELFGDLDDDDDHLVRPSDFLKKGRKKQ